MNTRRFQVGLGILASCVMLSACFGGGSSRASGPVMPAVLTVLPSNTPSDVTVPRVMPTTAPAQIAAHVPVRVQLSFDLGAQSTAASARRAYAYTRTAQAVGGYISPSNTQLTVGVTPFGGSTTNYGPSSCTSNASCTVSFTALPGAATLRFTFTNGASTLSSFSSVVVIAPNTINTFAFSANPVVNSIALVPALASITAGSQADDVIAVQARDAAGNIIAGAGSYVDSAGNPVTLTLGVQNIQAGGRGTMSLRGQTRIIGPGQGTTSVHYDGMWLDRSVVSVAASSPLVAGAQTTIATIPHVTEYAGGVSGGPRGITSGPDGNLWFTEFFGNLVGKVTTSGAVTTYACGSCFRPSFIVTGPDGNLWFAEDDGKAINKMSTSGTVTRVASLPSFGIKLVVGPDGNLWVAENDPPAALARVTPTGVLTSYAASVGARGIAFGSDQSIWLNPFQGASILRLNRSGQTIGTYSIAYTSNDSEGDVLGPDGNMWFVNSDNALLYRITNSGTITSYAMQSGATPMDMVVGPDGNLWWSENGKDAIGRMSTSASTPTEYGAAYGISSGAGPLGITVGPDGNIWFTESSASRIGKFVL